MSVAVASTSSTMLVPGPGRRGSDKSWEERQPIPWEEGARTDARPPSITIWRGGHPVDVRSPEVIYQAAGPSHSRSTSIMSIGLGPALASRSRVSMDALPVDYETDSHATISPTSSSASLPMMDETPPPPRATAIQPAHPVGLGLSAFTDEGRHEFWPPSAAPQAVGLDEEADTEDEEEVHDQDEMDNYMASHRVPVDAAIRSMPGVVGLGDGWAGGPAPKTKRRWFRRPKKEEAPTDSDPLALWSMPETPTTATHRAMSPAATKSVHSRESKNSPDNKWWKSRRNLFGASQRALAHPLSPSPTTMSDAPMSPTTPKTSHPPTTKAWRSKLNFGSMVDLRRTEPRSDPRAETHFELQSQRIEPRTPDVAPLDQCNKRHSVATFLRKPPPHPLELSHSNGSTPSSRSQPMGLSASSSQPSLLSPLSHHPMLRQAYARSESHLAGAQSASASNGLPPRPAPLIIHSGSFVNSAPMPQLWRPPMMSSPTPLLEVQEEDEEEHEPPESTDRPLKRSATFGDEEELAAQKASAAPELSDISGSPIEGERALSETTTFSTHNGDHLAPPPSKFLNRLKTVLTLGRGRTKSNAAPPVHAGKAPESPRSFASEPVPPVPTNLDVSQFTKSVGRETRRRSRLFSRRRESLEAGVMASPPVVLSPSSPSPAPQQFAPQQFNVSKLSEKQPRTSIQSSRTLGVTSLQRETNRARRTSWAAPLPAVDDDDDEDDVPVAREKRLSRVSLRRFKGQSKQRPPLGTVFPRPPTEMQAPPSLHWAFPASYSTPMLHKFGGSTLSLALDISAEGAVPNGGLDDIQESPTRDKPSGVTQRERALSATIAALTARQTSNPTTVERRPSVGDRRLSAATTVRQPSNSERLPALNDRRPSNGNGERRSSNASGSLRTNRTIPINMENLSSSNDSLTLPSCGVVDFPLPPSDSSGDVSSPDPDHVEHLCTPRDARTYPTVPTGYYRRQPTIDSVDEESLHNQPSWSTCKTSGETVRSGVTPLATPTSSTSVDDTRCSSYGSLFTAMEGDNSEQEHTPRATYTHTPKRLSLVALPHHPAAQQIVL